MKEDYENIDVGFEQCFQQINTFINNPVLKIARGNHINYSYLAMCSDYKASS